MHCPNPTSTTFPNSPLVLEESYRIFALTIYTIDGSMKITTSSPEAKMSTKSELGSIPAQVR